MSRAPISRPTLLPGLPRVWRDPRTLQLGLDPASAILVELSDPRVARLLDLLDGRLERVALARAAALGVPADEARALLDTLLAAGLVVGAHALLPAALTEGARHQLVGEATALALRNVRNRHEPGPTTQAASRASVPTPAQILRRRSAARVTLAGRGRLAAGIAVALAQAGVGHIDPDLNGHVPLTDVPGSPLTATDAGRPRDRAVADAVRRAAPDTNLRSARRGAASLVVQLGHDQPVALLAAAHAGRRQAHLAVTIRDGTAIVGPLVPPSGGPCLNCVDLHRIDRDPGWPQLAGQLGTPAPELCDVATVLAATAYATAEALTYLDGGTPESLGAAIEITAPGRPRRRTWAQHPSCGCGRRRRPTEFDHHPKAPEMR